MSQSFNWQRYSLTDIPFVDVPAINVSVKDPRINGQLFCEEVVQAEFAKLMRLISTAPSVVYLNSAETVLGAGKSALMAAAYWKIKDQKKVALWAEATGGLSASTTLGRVIDGMVAEGLLDELRQAIGTVDYQSIHDRLTSAYSRPLPTMVGALQKILQIPAEDKAKKFANIRRSIQVSTPIELFGYLIALLGSVGLHHPFIFIDQFEEYVQSHFGRAMLSRLGGDVNDLLRACGQQATLILSLHPEAENTLMSAAGQYVRTFAPISEATTVTLQRLSPPQSVIFTRFYLDKFRTENYTEDPLRPFTEEVVRYIGLVTRGVPRDLIIALRRALIEGALQGYVPLNEDFIENDKNHGQVLLDSPNLWSTYKQGKMITS